MILFQVAVGKTVEEMVNDLCPAGIVNCEIDRFHVVHNIALSSFVN